MVPSKSKQLIDTGLSLAIPPGHYGRVAPRSGLAVKHFIDTGKVYYFLDVLTELSDRLA